MTPTLTDSLRRAFESCFDIFVSYYVLSRSSSRCEIQELLVAFCVVCAVMAAIATFEGAKHWLLYGQIRGQWGPHYNPYLARGESCVRWSLRASIDPWVHSRPGVRTLAVPQVKC